MKYCQHCNASIKGEWETCPLCHNPLDETTAPASIDPYPKIPLRFNKEIVWKYLTLISFALIIAFLLIELIWIGRMENLQLALFGIMSMWLSVLILIRKRRNIAKSIVYLIVSLSLLCIYLDYLTGWSGWSTTYAVPIICSFAIISLYIAVRLVNLGVRDYVLYLLTAALLGLLPALFLTLDWVTTPLPASLSVMMSAVTLIIILLYHGGEIWRELEKRMHV
jgi:hypothetical protein